MTSEIQAEANRRNALQSTGPKTGEGIEAARFNALRHGLRSLQTVVPGEAPEEWETHRAAVVGDLKPLGAVEMAMAEQVAAKLWRLGRVVRHEADMISIGQDPEELALAHEAAHQEKHEYQRRKQGVAIREDVEEAASALRTARGKLTRRDEAIRLLKSLPTMGPDVHLPWEFAEDLMHAVSVDEKTAAKLEKECETNESGFVSRHALALLSLKGNPEEMAKSLAEFWREDRKDFVKAARKAAGKYKRTLRRYEAALDRLRGSRGLPDEAVLDKIQRYEAHLERGLHKALERLQMLQEARGAFCSIEPQARRGPGGLPEPRRFQRNGFVRQFCQWGGRRGIGVCFPGRDEGGPIGAGPAARESGARPGRDDQGLPRGEGGMMR